MSVKQTQRFDVRDFRKLVANEFLRGGSASYKMIGISTIHIDLWGFLDEASTFIAHGDLVDIFNCHQMVIHHTDSYLGKNTGGITDFPLLAVIDHWMLAHKLAHLLDYLHRHIFRSFMHESLLFRDVIDDALDLLPKRSRAYYKDRGEVFARMFEIGYSWEVMSSSYEGGNSVYMRYPEFSRYGLIAGGEPLGLGFEFEEQWGKYNETWVTALKAAIRRMIEASRDN